MNYQDSWTEGQPIAKGYRECALRYAPVRDFCARFRKPFSVLDIGANQCYFGLRLVEDFDCSVLAFEYSQFSKRQEHVKRADKTGRIQLWQKKVSLADLEFMASFAHFDLILVLSVLHHVDGEFDAWVAALKKLGTNIIAELASDDCRSKRKPIGYRVPDGVTFLGEFGSHIRPDINRPMVLINGQQNA